MNRVAPDAALWLGGVPLDVRLAELAKTGMSRTDALLRLLEWAIRYRPQEEVELLLNMTQRHESDLSPEVVGDLRWLQGFAALRACRYTSALAFLSPLSDIDQVVGRALGPHERGPQVLAAVLVAQVFRELGAGAAASEHAEKALYWLGDLGATDFRSCGSTAGSMWTGAHFLGFELEVGRAEDALAGNDLASARRHAVAARRWLPPRALDIDGKVPWFHRVTLLLLWSKLSLARGWPTAAVHSAELALSLAERYHALPYMTRCSLQRGLALLGAPFDPVRYILEPGSRQPLPESRIFLHPLATAATMAEDAGMAGLSCTAHLTLGALFAGHDGDLARLHVDRALRLADGVKRELPPVLRTWWELSRMTALRMAHIAVHHAEPSMAHGKGEDEAQPMHELDDIPRPSDLEGELRAALRHAGYALVDETGAGAILSPAEEGRFGVVVGWQLSAALDEIQAAPCSARMMKDLPEILEALGFMARPYDRDPGRLIVEGMYSLMLAADDEDRGDRAARWYDSEAAARRAQLGWLADTRVCEIDASVVRRGLADHPLRDLVVQILIVLDDAGLPLHVDQPNNALASQIGVCVYPHSSYGSCIRLSWEARQGNRDEYQQEVFRRASQTLIERVLNAAGIVTHGDGTDGAVYVFAQAQELSVDPSAPQRSPYSPST